MSVIHFSGVRANVGVDIDANGDGGNGADGFHRRSHFVQKYMNSTSLFALCRDRFTVGKCSMVTVQAFQPKTMCQT